MSIGIFTEKKYRPSENEIFETIGSMLPAWQSLTEFIRTNYTYKEDFKFQYGKNYGWALRFEVKKKLFTALYPAQNSFTVQVILNPEAVVKAQQMKLSKKTQQAIAKANPYPEGRWIFVPVESDNELKDIRQLLLLKSEMFK